MSNELSILNKIGYPIVVVEKNNKRIVFSNFSFQIEFRKVDQKNEAFESFWSKSNEETFEDFLKYKQTSPLVYLNDKYQNSKPCCIQLSNLDNDHVILSIHDASEFKCQKNNLELLSKKFNDLLDITNTGYAILDNNLVIQECNLTLTKSLGFEQGSLIGENIAYLLTKDQNTGKEHLLCSLAMSLEKNCSKMQEFEINIKKSNGESKWVSMKANSFGDNKIACLFHDITNKKNEEQRKFINGEKKKDNMLQNLKSISKCFVTKEDIV